MKSKKLTNKKKLIQNKKTNVMKVHPVKINKDKLGNKESTHLISAVVGKLNIAGLSSSIYSLANRYMEHNTFHAV